MSANTAANSAANGASAPAATATNGKAQFLTLLRHNLTLIERGVAHVEQRYIARVLRSLPYVRRQLQESADVLALLVGERLASDAGARGTLLRFLPEAYKPKAAAKGEKPSGAAMDEDAPAAEKPEKPRASAVEALPEVAAYLRLLVIAHLLDKKHPLNEVTALCQAAVNEMMRQNRRSLDPLGAKLIFFLGRCRELSGEGLASMRDDLLALQRTASLRHDAETNATVQNLLLRLYIVEGNQYDQADKLVARAPFPRTKASNPQVARYDYYVGRIRAVELNLSLIHI